MSLNDAIEMYLQERNVAEFDGGGSRGHVDDKIKIISKIAMPDVQEKVFVISIICILFDSITITYHTIMSR